MRTAYRALIRPVLFSQDSEAVHDRVLRALEWAGRHPWASGALGSLFSATPLPVRLFGLDFPNPVGLAAGMDKKARAVPVWAALGFGFSELGGVTWLPQPGNDAPRMFRAPAAEALVNRMGFNNPGAVAMAQTLASWRALGRWPQHPVGVNLGKSKLTPLADAAQDYAQSFKTLWPLADFFVVNVSSPNTPNLRQLQDKAALDEIFSALREVSASLSSAPAAPGSTPSRPKPLLVKVAPDLGWEALDEIVELVARRGIDGIVATNTTITRPDTTDETSKKVFGETGGLSGKPLRARSTEVVRHLYRQSGGKIPVIGVGGIFSADDAWEKIVAGASLVQIYTGFVYEGPGLTRDIVEGLRQKLAERGFKSIAEAVGSENRAPAAARPGS